MQWYTIVKFTNILKTIHVGLIVLLEVHFLQPEDYEDLILHMPDQDDGITEKNHASLNSESVIINVCLNTFIFFC